MKRSEINRFNRLYQRHLGLLKLQGKSQKTIDAYSRSVRRIRDHFDCCPDQLTPEQLETYFGQLVETPLLEHRQDRSKRPAIFLAARAPARLGLDSNYKTAENSHHPGYSYPGRNRTDHR